MSRCPHCYSEINFGATKCLRCTGDIVYDDKPLTHWKAFALIGAIGAPILDSYANGHWRFMVGRDWGCWRADPPLHADTVFWE